MSMSKSAAKQPNSSIRDLTTGSPMRLILQFALPLIGGNLFQQFYNLCDTLIVGKTLGVSALAGVGATGPVNFLIVGFSTGICCGFSIPIAQRFGAKDYDGMRDIVAHSYYLTLFFMLLLTAASSLLTGNILHWMDTPADIFDYSYQYLLPIFLGMPLVMLYNLFAGMIRALGDSKTPVFYLIIASILNIILDVVFILVFHLGVAGAAYATNISQGVSALLSFLYIRRKIPLLKLEKSNWVFRMSLIKLLTVMGIPMGLQYSITAIGGVILQGSVNSLGSIYVASMTAGQKVSMFFSCPTDAFGSALATYAGQNVGAGKPERLNEGLKCATIIGGVYCIFTLIIQLLFRRNLLIFFVGAAETEVLYYASSFLLINTAFYFFLVYVNAVRFMIQGMGFPGFAIFAGLCEMIARAVAGLILIPLIGWYGACLSSPLAWIAADLFLFPAYFSKRKKIYQMLGKSL